MSGQLISLPSTHQLVKFTDLKLSNDKKTNCATLKLQVSAENSD